MTTSLDRLTNVLRPTIHARVVPAAVGIPWYVFGVTAAATAVYVGVIWDISWHMTIGRDTFWSPPHMVTYLSAILVGVSCGYVALKTTIAGSAEERARSVG